MLRLVQLLVVGIVAAVGGMLFAKKNPDSKVVETAEDLLEKTKVWSKSVKHDVSDYCENKKIFRM